MSIESDGVMISTGINLSVHSLLVLSAESYSSKTGGSGDGNDEFGVTKYISSHCLCDF